MSYISKLDLSDYIYLNEHPEGLKCWQTDYRLLRERNEEISYNNFMDDLTIFNAKSKLDNEKPLLFKYDD